jgi:hypothetical protein
MDALYLTSSRSPETAVEMVVEEMFLLLLLFLPYFHSLQAETLIFVGEFF